MLQGDGGVPPGWDGDGAAGQNLAAQTAPGCCDHAPAAAAVASRGFCACCGMRHPQRCRLLWFAARCCPGAAPAPWEHSDMSLSSPCSTQRARSSFGVAFDAGVSAGSQQCTDPPLETPPRTPRLSQTQAGHCPRAAHPSCLPPSLDLLSVGAEPRGQGREGCPRMPLIAPSPAHAARVLGFAAGFSPPLAALCGLGGCPHPWQPPTEQL